MSHAQYQYWQIARLGTVPNGKFPEVESKKGQYWKWVPECQFQSGKLRVWVLTKYVVLVAWLRIAPSRVGLGRKSYLLGKKKLNMDMQDATPGMQ